jgi:hypothetical protein
MVLVGAHALFGVTGCAHLSPSVSACKPVASDVDLVLADLQSDGWQAALEQLAVAKGLCLVNAAVDQVIAALSQAASTRAVLAGADDTLSRARAWRAAHP